MSGISLPCPSADQSCRVWLCSLISSAGAFLSQQVCVPSLLPRLSGHRALQRVGSPTYSIGRWQPGSWDPITSFPVGFFLKSRGKTFRVPFVCNFLVFLSFRPVFAPLLVSCCNLEFLTLSSISYFDRDFRNGRRRTSLVVQWLRSFCLPIQF